jgi:hypothetical protein
MSIAICSWLLLLEVMVVYCTRAVSVNVAGLDVAFM